MSTALPLSTKVQFSDEQAMLLETATDFFRRCSPAELVRDRLASQDGYAPDVWQNMVELGWLGLAVKEELGGSALGLGAAVTIAEPMGRHLAALPFFSTQLFVQGLTSANPSLADPLLMEVVAGAPATVALFEQQGSWSLSNPTARAEQSGAAVQLSGAKTFVLDAAVADNLLALVAYDNQPRLVLVPQSSLPNGALHRETVIDETRRSYRLNLDGVEVPESHVLSETESIAGLERISQAAWLLLAAEASGGIAGVLDLLVEYLTTRTAFGRKIGSYQGLKHPTVDILVGLERSRSHLYHAATLVDAAEEASVALRMAKAHSSESFALAGDRAIQFHGGFGFTYDCDAQLYLRRALWTQASFGDPAHHRRALADLLF